MQKPQWNLFDKVCIDQSDQIYQIVGFYPKIGYDFRDWEYVLYKEGWENRGEYCNEGSRVARTDNLMTLESLIKRKRARAEKALKEAQDLVDKLSKDLEKL